MSTSPIGVTAILFLLATTTTTTFCFQELEILETIQDQIAQTRNWAHSFARVVRLNDPLDHRDHVISHVSTVALSDCAKLYDASESRLAWLVANENYTRDDALTWLSAVLANHRTCLDGLAEKGFRETTHAVPQNLTILLGKALALYAKVRGIKRGRTPRSQIRSPGGGILTSWSPATSKADFVVAKDGSGTHSTINEALAAVGRMGTRRGQRVILYVKAGVYNEKVEIRRHMRNLMFVGDGMDRTIVTASHNVADGSSTFSSATFGVSGDRFWARDMTFENTAGPQKQQAVALMVASDHSVFYRCCFRAYQDTLFVHSLRQFYCDCHIYGTIDFIFGDASVVLQNCDILVRRPMNQQANMITAQGRDDANENTGISIQGSRIRPAPDLVGVENSFNTFLGRPWKKYSRTVVFQSDLDGLIHPRGWTEWSGNFALSTLFYAEYQNIGVGASTDGRVKWPGFHVFKDPHEASPFTVNISIQGQLWIPETGVPYQLGV